MEITVAVVALAIAIWQLHLQRIEIRLNGQINTLVHMATMLKDRIEYHEKIIQDMKHKEEDWTGHAKRVNNELRPLLAKVNRELVNTIAGQKGALNDSEIKRSLQLSGDQG